MIFTDFRYLMFLGVVFAAYWLARSKFIQNPILLAASYVFYGFVHPWFCVLLATSTLVDYGCALGMARFAARRRFFLILSLGCNLGLLGFFKYFNFFAENIHRLLCGVGLAPGPFTLEILLPVGISFYTFQTMSYTIDVYRGRLPPRKNLIDFAVFVSFFPQLVAGPIERATCLLPQVEATRRWDWDRFLSAWPLLVEGYLKKMVIADNVALYVDKVFMLRQPSLFLLACGTLAFAVQIYADFSAYTDIARGSAKLLGFELMENFRAPYLAISPSDFWRRWHVSFSSWIRDYLYIPLGGSRVESQGRYVLVLLATFGLSGLWHGAAWNFVAWGIYHAVLLFIYHRLGLAGRWRPTGHLRTIAAWICMFCLTMVGWTIFRAPSMEWLIHVFGRGFSLGLLGDSLSVSLVILISVAMYSLPLFVLVLADRVPGRRLVHSLAYSLAIVLLIGVSADSGADFIYFQF